MLSYCELISKIKRFFCYLRKFKNDKNNYCTIDNTYCHKYLEKVKIIDWLNNLKADKQK